MTKEFVVLGFDSREPAEEGAPARRRARPGTRAAARRGASWPPSPTLPQRQRDRGGAGEDGARLLRGTGRVVRPTAMGGYAEEWISEVSLAVRAEVPVAAHADVVQPFPTYGEVLEGPLWTLAARLPAS